MRRLLIITLGSVIELALGLAARAEPGLSSPVKIPIYNTESRIIVYVALGTNRHAYPYVFDTGSFAFATALGTNPRYWGGVTYQQTGSFSISYGSGALSYSGPVGTSTVKFCDESSRPAFEVSDAKLGLITKAPREYPDWDRKINAEPPVAPELAKTFGTFGAGLAETSEANGNMSSVLGQIPISPSSGMDQGFIVRRGGVREGEVTVGLSKSAIADMPILVRMQPSTGSLTTSTGQTARLYPEDQLKGKITLINERGERYSADILVIVDSGGLGQSFVRSRSGANGFSPPRSFMRGRCIAPGVRFSLTIPGVDGHEGLDWSFRAGTERYVNRLYMYREDAGAFNTGISIYRDFDVMFDMTRGVMGFKRRT